MPLFIAITAFVGIAMLVFVLADHYQERATVRASLRQLNQYEVANVRDRQLLESIGSRVGAPLLQGLVEVGRRFTPLGYVEKTKKKLTITGQGRPSDVDRFLAIRVCTIVAIPLGLILVFFGLHLHGKEGLAVALLLIVGLILGPDAVINRRMEERKLKIRRQLPDILDLLTISVEAGLGFEQALDRTVSNVPGYLSDEFVRMLGEVRAGASRADAMRAIDDRTDVPEVRSFVLAILQADTFGVSIGKILRAQADEMRVKRRQLAQERAQKAPVKMLIPMISCIFPALFVVILGPATIQLLHNFKHGIGHS